MILLDIDHCVHFHQAGVIFKRHKVSGLVADIKQQRECSAVIEVLHHALGAVHSAELFGAGNGIECGLLGALIGKDKADIGFIAAGGGYSGVDIHVVIGRNIIVALGCSGYILLPKQRIDVAALVGAIVIVLIHNDLGRVNAIYPGRNIGIVLAFAGNGIDQYRPLNIGAAKQANPLDNAGANPIGCTFFINFEGGFIKDEGRILEPQMTVQVAAEMFGRCIVHSLRQTNNLHFLRHHIDDEVGRQTSTAVIEPLKDIAIPKRSNPNRAALIVDLSIVFGHFKLAYHIGQFAQLAVTQLFGRVAIQHGDLIERDLLNILRKVTGFHGQQLSIGPAAQNDAGKQAANHINNKYCRNHNERYSAAALQQFPKGLSIFRLAVDAGGDNCRNAVHHRNKQEESVEGS